MSSRNPSIIVLNKTPTKLTIIFNSSKLYSAELQTQLSCGCEIELLKNCDDLGRKKVLTSLSENDVVTTTITFRDPYFQILKALLSTLLCKSCSLLSQGSFPAKFTIIFRPIFSQNGRPISLLIHDAR
jgi:hypothetical protein